MKITNTAQSYGFVTKLIHLLISISFIVVLILGYIAMYMLGEKGRVSPLYYHKAIGILIFIIGVFWILWAVLNKKPSFEMLLPWEQWANKITKLLLFAGILVLPISGLLIAVFAGEHTHVFNLFRIEPWFDKFQPGVDLFRAVHDYFSWFITLIVLIHIGAAFKHLIINKDRIMQRMWSFWGKG